MIGVLALIMEEKQFRVLIKYYFLHEKTITETEKKLEKYNEDSSSSWYGSGVICEFRCGRTSTADAERSGRSFEIKTEEIVTKIHDIVLGDRRVKVREIAV